MIKRDEYPAGVPCWVDTAQPDPNAAVAFYSGLFGWEFADRMPPEAPTRYFVGRLHDADVAAVGTNPPDVPQATPVWNTYIAVDNADDTAKRVISAGGQVLVGPFDVVHTGRMAVCVDSTGAGFCIWQARSMHGSQLVNYDNTWNASTLNTRDPQGAKDFYGAVFGWVARPFDFEDAYMLCVPGYADFLERIDPGVRQRHAEGGAPEGFSDAIGWMSGMPANQFPADVPSHWSVTFSVNDPDTSAQRAEQLGGTITAPPMTVPYARLAVITDPQGAVFTISKYIPEG